MSGRFMLQRLETGLIRENCYVITDAATGETAVIDPGSFDERLKKAVGEPAKVKYILLTHRHFDHVTGVPGLKAYTGAKVIIHGEDAPGLKDEMRRAASSGFQPVGADLTVGDGDTLTLGGLSIRVLHTPGHTKGGVCYIIDDVVGSVMFSGDTLFLNDIGRMDFPDGDWRDMVASLKKLEELPGDYTVYPGHGPSTTLGFERKNNRYFGKTNYDDFTH